MLMISLCKGGYTQTYSPPCNLTGQRAMVLISQWQHQQIKLIERGLLGGYGLSYSQKYSFVFSFVICCLKIANFFQ